MIKVNPARLLEDLAALRQIGGQGTGVVREAFTATDLEGRRWLARRFTDAGLRPVWDPVGNLFGLPETEKPAVLIGSHSDSQPEGGWLDGSYGVVCGLEIARAAQEAGLQGIAVVSFADEEGTFEPLLGSRVWSGELALSTLQDRTDRMGRKLADTLASVPELRAAKQVPHQLFKAYIEAHIEQGPVLDDAGEAIGVVETIVGMQHVEVVVVGDQNHAGTTPMDRRHDAVMSFVAFAHAVDEAFCSEAGPATVWTFGRVNVTPNATSIIPGRVDAMLQIRDPDQARLNHLAARAQMIAKGISAKRSVEIRTQVVAELPPAPLDAALAGTLIAAAGRLAPGRWRRMVSGALHDAVPVSRIMPSAMLFVPSIAGKSHCFEEDTRSEDLVQGCAVLSAAIETLLLPGP
ncbi:hydantoinase/carbamoylase family amidase [Microvirga roseola]|uniref:hydantoinase/carbamoylase family amidase n=1 Tax=Microvirga roseola TaxID=2883126 RepID=UPI001E457323|nr:hydantoinase/carbamoylase family amidase [Microvirga roseola]